MINLEKLILQYRPFNPPPAPKPLGNKAYVQEPAQESQGPKRAKSVTRRSGRKSWSTPVPVTGMTGSSGPSNLAAYPFPTIEITMPAFDRDINRRDEMTIHQPFLNRMRERQRRFDEKVEQGRGPVLLISVKRQRKLKMKKHKYKKLMKRTRTLRRKLDRT